MRLGFPLSLSTKIGLPLLTGMAVFTAGFAAKPTLATYAVVAIAVFIGAVMVGGDWFAYRLTPGRDVMVAAKAQGYNGPPLQFPKQWRHPKDLQPGEVTCVRYGSIVTTQTGTRLTIDNCAHAASNDFGYVVWRQNSLLIVMANTSAPERLPRSSSANDKDSVVIDHYFEPGSLSINCPHFLRPSY